MDANTERGRAAIEDLRAGLASIGDPYIETPQDRPSDIDGFFLDRGSRFIVAAFEGKARYGITYRDFMTRYGGEWLVTHDKLLRGAAVARSLCIPFYGIVYLVESRVTMAVKIANRRGEIVARLRVEETVTRATCNGGEAKRVNAFVDMKEAKIWR